MHYDQFYVKKIQQKAKMGVRLAIRFSATAAFLMILLDYGDNVGLDLISKSDVIVLINLMEVALF